MKKKNKTYKIKELKEELRESHFGWVEVGKGEELLWNQPTLNWSSKKEKKEQHSQAAGNEPHSGTDFFSSEILPGPA